MSRIEKTLIIMALAVGLLHLGGAFLPDPRLWGFHQYAFLPRPLLLLLILPLLLFIPPVTRAAARALDPAARSLETKTGARVLATLAIAVLAVLFWLGRPRAFLLSDSELLIRSVNQGFVRFTADTLAAVIQLQFHHLLRRLFHVTSQTASFRVVSIAAGLIWLTAVFLATARLTRNGWERLFLGGLLATAGLTKLFYGYVETGPIVMAAVGVYFWAMIRWIQDRRGVIAATIAFLAAAAVHVTGLLLFPSFLFGLLLWARRDSKRLVAAAGAVLLPVAVYMWFWFSRGGNVAGVVRSYAPYFSEFIPLTGPIGTKQAFTVFSFAHLLDFLNEQIFIGPFALLAAVAAFAIARRRAPVAVPSGSPTAAAGGRAPTAAAGGLTAAAAGPTAAAASTENWIGPMRMFLLLAILPFLLLSLLFNRKLGGARDWDLLAILSVPSILFVALSVFRSAPNGNGEAAGSSEAAGPERRPGRAASTAGSTGANASGARAEAGKTRHPAPAAGWWASAALPATAVLLIAVSAAHLAGIVLVDADESRSVEHFKALLDDRAAMSRFARSYGLEELGHYYIGLGQPEVASTWFRKAAEADPSNVKAIGTLGAYYGAAGRHAEAVPLLREAVRQRPEIALSHYNLAAELARTESWDEAAAAFAEAIRRDPRLLQAYTGLSIVLSRQGRLAEADSVITKALTLYPGDPQNLNLYLTRGTVLDRQGKVAQAEAAYRSALALDPDNHDGLFNLGRLLVNREAWNDAIAPLERLGRLAPDDGEAAVNLGVALLQVGRNDEAISALSRAIRANPHLSQAYLNLAGALYRTGKPAEAIGVLEAFIAADPQAARSMNVPAMIGEIRAAGAGASGPAPAH